MGAMQYRPAFEVRPLAPALRADVAAVAGLTDVALAAGALNVIWAWHRANDAANLAGGQGVYTGVIAKALAIAPWSVEREELNDALFALRGAGILAARRDEESAGPTSWSGPARPALRWFIPKGRRQRYGLAPS